MFEVIINLVQKISLNIVDANSVELDTLQDLR